MHNGVCVAENAFLQARELRIQSNGGLQQNGLHCLLASSDNTNAVTSAQVMWLYPNGKPVHCSNTFLYNQNYIGCLNAANSNGAILYTSNSVNNWPSMYNGVYTCCLPGNCSDDSTNSITVWIFGQSALYQ